MDPKYTCLSEIQRMIGLLRTYPLKPETEEDITSVNEYLSQILDCLPSHVKTLKRGPSIITRDTGEDLWDLMNVSIYLERIR